MAYHSVYLPKHPRADIAGFVPVHILIAQAVLGYVPCREGDDKGTIVHHRDFDKGHNHPDNYTYCTRAEHQQIPACQAVYLIEKGLYEDYHKWWVENRTRVAETVKLKQQIIDLQERSQRQQIKHLIKRLKEVNEQLTACDSTAAGGVTAFQASLSDEARRLSSSVNELNAKYIPGLPEEVLSRVCEIIDSAQDPSLLYVGPFRSHWDRVHQSGQEDRGGGSIPAGGLREEG